MQDVNEKRLKPKHNQYSQALALASLMLLHLSEKKASLNCSEIRASGM
jgi:hypothetical protein